VHHRPAQPVPDSPADRYDGRDEAVQHRGQRRGLGRGAGETPATALHLRRRLLAYMGPMLGTSSGIATHREGSVRTAQTVSAAARAYAEGAAREAVVLIKPHARTTAV
jgi:hypothetical protein